MDSFRNDNIINVVVQYDYSNGIDVVPLASPEKLNHLYKGKRPQWDPIYKKKSKITYL